MRSPHYRKGLLECVSIPVSIGLMFVYVMLAMLLWGVGVEVYCIVV